MSDEKAFRERSKKCPSSPRRRVPLQLCWRLGAFLHLRRSLSHLPSRSMFGPSNPARCPKTGGRRADPLATGMKPSRGPKAGIPVVHAAHACLSRSHMVLQVHTTSLRGDGHATPRLDAVRRNGLAAHLRVSLPRAEVTPPPADVLPGGEALTNTVAFHLGMVASVESHLPMRHITCKGLGGIHRSISAEPTILPLLEGMPSRNTTQTSAGPKQEAQAQQEEEGKAGEGAHPRVSSSCLFGAGGGFLPA